MQLHTYLNYDSNYKQAFHFYEQHLGSRITMMMKHNQQPNQNQIPPNWKNAILHTHMNLNGTELLNTNIPPDRFQPIRNAYLSLTINSIDETERIHALLADSNQIFIPMAKTFFAHRFSMLRNRFGTSWMLLHPKPQTA